MSDKGGVSPEILADLIAYFDFAEVRLRQWEKEVVIREYQLNSILAAYAARRDKLTTAWRDDLPVPDEIHLPVFPEPVRSHPLVRTLRLELALQDEIKSFSEKGTLGLAQSHACLSDMRERIAAIKNRLAQEMLFDVEPCAPESPPDRVREFIKKHQSNETNASVISEINASAATVESQPEKQKKDESPPVSPIRGLMETLLDPRSLQYLMTFGGGLLVLGLVIWLWAVGVFENKLVVATVMGLGTLGLLSGGWAILRLTRFKIAGQAITLLACLVMPLNLWFYHAQGLMTLEGHLWMAGVICCILYAATAWLLQEPIFVYVSVAGVTLTGLLILADEHVAKLWEIAAPSTLLVAIGLISIHAERAFSSEGPFSRKRFGMAFFWSGLAVMSGGLLMLLGAQVTGWLYDPYFHHWGLSVRPEIADKRILQALALGLALAGTYAYVYCDVIARRTAFLYLAVFTFMWAEVLAVKVLAIEMSEEVAIIALALTALAANLVQALAKSSGTESSSDEAQPASENLGSSLARIGQPMGAFLCAVPVILGLELHFRATYSSLNAQWPFHIDVMYVIAMAVTALSARIGAHLYRHTKPLLSATYFFATAAATLLAARGLLSIFGINTTEALAPWLMLIPIAYLIASRLYRGNAATQPLMQVAQSATAIMSLAVLAASIDIAPAHVFEPIRGARTNLLLALFFAEAAVFYVMAAIFGQQGFNIYFATSAACGAVWQLLNFWHVQEDYYTLIFAMIGLALLITYRFAELEKFKFKTFAQSALQCGNGLLSISFVAAILMSLSRVASKEGVHSSLLFLLLSLIFSSLIAAWLVREDHWRRWYIVTAVAEGFATFLVLNVLSDLTIYEKMEIFSVSAGLLLLALGHIGWYRERNVDRHHEWVSISLFFGSVLASAPLIIAVLVQRSHRTVDWTTLRVVNEIGMLAIGLTLLGTGTVFKLKATTIAGSAMMLVYLFSLAFFLRIPEKLQTVAVYMMLGGGAFFGTAVLLSVYRDRLIALPGTIKRREGVFRVLSWR